MKTNDIGKDEIFNSDEGITVVIDRNLARQYSKRHDKKCIALKEKNLGYGVFLAEDGETGVYGSNPIARKFLSMFWDENEEEILKHLNELYNAGDVEELVKFGIAIIYTATMNILEEYAESEDDLGA